MKAMSYDKHLASNMHRTGMSRSNKFVCERGETNLKSKSHISKLYSSNSKSAKKVQYQANIDTVNCCKRWLKVYVPDQYFIPLCLCCDEILKYGNNDVLIVKNERY
jgi:hypothetical protein